MSATSGQQGQESEHAFLLHVHTYINDYIRFADTKAVFILGATGGIMVWLLSKIDSIPADGPMWPTAILLIPGLPLGFSFTFAMQCVFPRLGSSKRKGLVFWESIYNTGREQYLVQVQSLVDTETRREIAEHTWDLAQVALKKYSNVSDAGRFFLFGFWLTVLCVSLWFLVR